MTIFPGSYTIPNSLKALFSPLLALLKCQTLITFLFQGFSCLASLKLELLFVWERELDAKLRIVDV